MKKDLVIGLDYGTDSVRTIIVDSASGREIATDLFFYPRWAEGQYCDPAQNRFRQHPDDFLEGLTTTVRNALEKAPPATAERIAGISIDTTGSTPIAVDEEGVALSLRDDFRENPNAMFILWKDHTAVKEAQEINEYIKTWGGEDYTRFEGGVYSSEWFWSKILHVLREDERIRGAAYSWVEHCDWIPAVLTGTENPQSIKRSRCAAGHKAMWHEGWGGLPPEEFLAGLDPLLSGLRDRLFVETYTADRCVGELTPIWAQRLGLPPGVKVGVGAFDAHMGAVGGQIKPYSFVKVLGTSTCDMLTVPAEEVGDAPVRGICGQVDGSIIPGLIGMEAGQSAFGDTYAWFKNILLWPLRCLDDITDIDADQKKNIMDKLSGLILEQLSEAAEKITLNRSCPIAVDWLNGRRTPDANQALKAAISGLDLGIDAPKFFRALVESTAFGARKIIDRFLEEGVPIKEVIAIGGVAKKSPFVMQILADVLNMEIKVARSEQSVALGAAMFAAVVAQIHETIEAAQDAMGSGFETIYQPNPEHAEHYKTIYERFVRLGDFIEKESIREGGM
jgi:L-ribulokinase